ncbi:LytR/AlgR family response regulator transcription factor [Thalassotalea ganghwensis]
MDNKVVDILVAEDEVILRESLVAKLKAYWPSAHIVASVNNGQEAICAINQMKPEVTFLDIQMGDISGIDVAKQIGCHTEIVFVTAFNQYAVEAFEQGAQDYLLKPFSDERLIACIERLQQRLQLPEYPVHQDIASKGYMSRINMQIGHKIWVVPIEDVVVFQANGRYIKVITKDREALIRLPLKQLLERLDPEIFWQVHRGTVININHLDYVTQTEGDKLVLHMKHNPIEVQVSRSYTHLFKQA